ncbi:MAG: hypothetical protein GX202_05690 [Firmicutes bacterium]|nr:hypothetical protein [Bacillota bacterium]
MENTFVAIKPQNFQDFWQTFPETARQDLCRGCDGSPAGEAGFFNLVCLLPGELAFLQKKGGTLSVVPDLEQIITPDGTIYGLPPAARCPYRHGNTCSPGRTAPYQPVECAIYPLVFARHGSDELDVSPYCPRQAAFRADPFLAKAKVVIAVYLLRYLEENWLRYRNALNLPLDPAAYHRLKAEKTGRPLTLQEIKACAAEDSG